MINWSSSVRSIPVSDVRVWLCWSEALNVVSYCLQTDSQSSVVLSASVVRATVVLKGCWVMAVNASRYCRDATSASNGHLWRMSWETTRHSAVGTVPRECERSPERGTKDCVWNSGMTTQVVNDFWKADGAQSSLTSAFIFKDDSMFKQQGGDWD